MAIVPIRLAYTGVVGDYMICERHELRVEGELDRKGTSPFDRTRWYRCPGLEEELKALDLKKEAAAAGMTLEEFIEDLDSEDRATWLYVIEMDDATVTIG